MSNYNNPIGLTPISPNPRINIFTAGSSALAKGDVVGLNPSTKVVEFFAPATHFFPIGVMASACAASGEARVITDPNCEYWAQFEGDFNAITSIGAYDLKGTTGVHEINGAAQIWGSVEVLGHFPIPGSDETGSNAKVRCRLAQGRIPGGVAVHKMIVRPGQWTDETLTGARAVTKADGDVLTLDPGGASRNVTFGADCEISGYRCRVYNKADAAENLVLKASDSTTIVTLNQNEGAELGYTGSAWKYALLSLAT